MKKIFLSYLFSMMLMGSFAQFIKSQGAYGTGAAELTWIDDKPALAINVHGGYLVNHRWLIGANATNILFTREINNKRERFQFNYYGLYTEYRFRPMDRVHLSAGVSGNLGWLENKVGKDQHDLDRDGDFTYVIQPRLTANIRIASFVQAQLFGSYRFTGNTNSTFHSKSNFNGVGVGAGVAFGLF